MSITMELLDLVNDSVDYVSGSVSSDGYFTQKIRPIFRLDDDCKKIQLKVTKGLDNTKAYESEQVGIKKDKTIMYYTFNIDDRTTGGVEYKFWIKLIGDKTETKYTQLTLKKSSNITYSTWRKAYKPSLEGIELSPTLSFINPSQTTVFFNDFLHRYSSNSTLSNFAIENVGTSSKPAFNVSIEWRYNGSVMTSTNLKCSTTITNNRLSFTISQSSISNMLNRLSYSGTGDLTFKIFLENMHGVEFTSDPVIVPVNYSTAPTFDLASLSSSVTFNGNNASIITKDCVLSFSGIKVQSIAKLSKLEVSAIKGEVKRTYELNNLTPSGNVYTINLTSTGLGPITIEEDFGPNISYSGHKIKFKVTNIVGESAESEITIDGKSVKSMKPGRGEFGSVTLSGNTLSVNLEIDDYGVHQSSITNNYMTFSARLYYENPSSPGNWIGFGESSDSTGYFIKNTKPDKNPTNAYTPKTYTKTFAFGDPVISAGKITIKVKCKIRLWPCGTTGADLSLESECTSYVWETEEYTFFTAVPTLSYRKNRVGINYNFPDDTFNDAALVVGGTTNQKKIVFKSQSGDNIVFDLSKRTIDNLIIDCGSWS